MGATDKQVRYAMFLMRKRGYSTDWMGSEHSKLGAKMRERRGKVSEWLGSLDRGRISDLIDNLK